MWVWDQSAGSLSHNGKHFADGYSGNHLGKNNPAMQAAVGIGPIPRGLWKITNIESGGHTGPFTIVLVPEPGTNTEGRSEFRIHGDSISDPGHASHGCIILPPQVRHDIWNSGDRALQVVA